MSYLEALDRELKDLAPDERADLLDEVGASLAEIEDDPESRLGPPARFAAELRASAGLPPAPAAQTTPRRSLRDALAPVIRFARELAPIWWVVRAYVVVLLLAAAFAAPVTKVMGIPRFGGAAEYGAVLLALALVASIAIGLLGRRRRLPARALRIALEVALAGVAIFLLAYEVDRRVEPTPQAAVAEAAPPPGITSNGVQVTNIYAYDRAGRLLHDVQLFDEYGRPLAITPDDPDPWRRKLRVKNGTTVFNTFPIRYYEPGTSHVKNLSAQPKGIDAPDLR